MIEQTELVKLANLTELVLFAEPEKLRSGRGDSTDRTGRVGKAGELTELVKLTKLEN